MDKLLSLVIGAAVSAGRAVMEVYDSPESDWQVERKADNSPLTLADRRSHEVIAAALAATPWPVLSEEGAKLPYAERKGWDKLWIVDPLDGTKEFIKRNGEFTVNIALVENGTPVLGVIYVPVSRRLYWGAKGIGAFTAEVDASTWQPGAARKMPQPAQAGRAFRVVASRSHLSPETESFIASLRGQHGTVEIVSAGSSLKICLVADEAADVYPRHAPTMEWDTAAGHAIAVSAGCSVTDAVTGKPLIYNKEDLHNPWFIVSR